MAYQVTLRHFKSQYSHLLRVIYFRFLFAENDSNEIGIVWYLYHNERSHFTLGLESNASNDP